jgi:hypothetical protein
MKKVFALMGKSILAVSSLALILSAAFITLLPGQAIATYRIPGTVILKPESPITPGKQIFQTCLSNDTQWAYFAYTPPSYDSNGTKLWPMLIFHMVNEGIYNSGSNIKQMFDSGRTGMNGSILYDLVEPQRTLGYLGDRFIVVTPFVDNFCNSNNGQPSRLMGLYKYLKTHLKVDTTRISMMGHCAGGGMVVTFAKYYPKFPSAIVAMSCNDTWRSTISFFNICNLKDVPYRHYGDKRDGMVPMQNQQAIYDTIVKCGGTKMELIWQDKNQHEIWGLSGLDTVKGMYDWMLSQQTSTSVVPKANENQKIRTSISNMSASDQIEVIGLNGKVIFISAGKISNLEQLFSNKEHGVRVVRVTHADGSVQRTILSKW